MGTRPEIIRLSRVLVALDQNCNHVLVHTGQNYDYELNQIFFEDLQLKKPDYFLNSAFEGSSAADTISKIISEVDKVLEKEAPDAMLVLGDTNSCLSVISAKRRKIPVFHMEAGNRCFDQRVPEEINRRIVDHTSDINLTYSDIARTYLLNEGFPPDRIIKTGSPLFEVLVHYLPQIKKSEILFQFDFTQGNYFIVSAHREENIDCDIKLNKLINLLNILSKKYDLPVLVSTHPRTRKRIQECDAKMHQNVMLVKPLGFSDYVQLQLQAKVVLSDSGTITEEASILGFPALNIREAHERPEGMEEAAVMMVGLESERVLQAIAILENQKADKTRGKTTVRDYSVPNVSEKILKIILSYTDYVNRVVWKKY